jgi:hypothetical protein
MLQVPVPSRSHATPAVDSLGKRQILLGRLMERLASPLNGSCERLALWSSRLDQVGEVRRDVTAD